MNNISKRLKTIGDIILKGNSKVVVDVGCDHGLLDIYLKLNNKDLIVIASDNKQEPLNSAINNIKRYNLEGKIKTILSDGIKDITSDTDTVVISGMGTDNIINILEHDNLKYTNRLVISSNNNYFKLREYITSKGFYINYEKIVYDDKYYIVIEFIKGNRKYIKLDLKYGPYLLKNKDYLFYEYYNFILNKYKNIVKNNRDITKINDLIEELTKILK